MDGPRVEVGQRARIEWLVRQRVLASLADLQAVEALCLRHDPAGLPDAVVARTLLELEAAGSHFYVDGDKGDAASTNYRVALVGYALPFDEGLALLTAIAAADDYKLVLRFKAPGETPTEAAHTLGALHRVLVPALGWERSREAFLFIEKGIARGAFPRPKEQTVDLFLQTGLLKRDLVAARRAVLEVPGQSRLERHDEDVVVNGIRIPRRR